VHSSYQVIVIPKIKHFLLENPINKEKSSEIVELTQTNGELPLRRICFLSHGYVLDLSSMLFSQLQRGKISWGICLDYMYGWHVLPLSSDGM
jgi:hypothetical protein